MTSGQKELTFLLKQYRLPKFDGWICLGRLRSVAGYTRGARRCGPEKVAGPPPGEPLQARGDTARAAREVWDLVAASGPASPRALELVFPADPAWPRHLAPSRCAARRAMGPVTASPASPTCGPSPCLPAPSPTPASSSPGFQLPSPALSRARSPGPALVPRVRRPQPMRLGAACADSNGGS